MVAARPLAAGRRAVGNLDYIGDPGGLPVPRFAIWDSRGRLALPVRGASRGSVLDTFHLITT